VAGGTIVTASDLPLRTASVALPAATKQRVGKRIFDVIVASLLLCLLSPVLSISWLLVRATSPGGAIFRQMRIGRLGHPFVMYKFRTMQAGCSDDIHREYVRKLLTDEPARTGGASGIYKLDADPRVTRIGRLLRRTSLDELPQLINVVRGDMSLVGPRPALPWEAELFTAAHLARFLAAPGVTGLWQTSGRNTLTMLDGLRLDLEYVRRQSFLLDLAILAKTVPAVLNTRGAR
jgi:lipopolysaccharide/colanic/teichoic acid biosynthesis glycosyltransferase